MDSFPVEIFHKIFRLACTDDGSTGRSLSVVSRAFNHLSRPAKLQSLAVTYPRQIHALARLLAGTQPVYRQVRYLFVASPGPGVRNDDGMSITKNDCQEVLHSFLSIILFMAPTLTILHVHFHFYGESLFFPIATTFPSLIELTLYGAYIEDNHKTNTAIASPPFPSLRYLHLSDLDSDPAESFGQVVRSAPLLTHLCLPWSFLNYVLSIALGTDLNTGTPTSTLPPTLQQVLIDSVTTRTWGPIGPLRISWEQSESVFMREVRIVVLRERPNTLEVALEFWSDRMEGGEGAWPDVTNL